jgi:hypothetical protein
MDSHKATSSSGPFTLDAPPVFAGLAVGAGNAGGSSDGKGKVLDVSLGEAVAQPASRTKTGSESARLVSIAFRSYPRARPSGHIDFLVDFLESSVANLARGPT